MAKVAFKTSDDINLFLGKKYLVNGEDATVASQSGNSGKYLTTDGSSTSWTDLPFNYAVETTISTTSATEIDSIDISTFTGAEFIVSLKQGSKVRTSKVIMQTDGTNVDMSEYAIVETGGLINNVDISVAAESGSAVLKAAASDANVTNVTATVLRINGEQGLSGVVTTSGVQTLTNKTIESPLISGSISDHINLIAGKSFKINNVAISASLPSLNWGDVKNGKSGLTIS
jgi:hypothetical protein